MLYANNVKKLTQHQKHSIKATNKQNVESKNKKNQRERDAMKNDKKIGTK